MARASVWDGLQGAIGIGAIPLEGTPPTPPGVRVRTGRFEKLRLGESWDPQAVEVSNSQHAIQA